jgi:hypothetical protein
MDIAHVGRSVFLTPCEQAIRDHAAILEAGGTIVITLDDGGYAGKVRIEIGDDPAMFGSDWENSDPTRFPARIKAAATALFHCGCRGPYEVEHRDGFLTIRRA